MATIVVTLTAESTAETSFSDNSRRQELLRIGSVAFFLCLLVSGLYLLTVAFTDLQFNM